MPLDPQIQLKIEQINDCVAGNEINNAIKILLDLVKDYAAKTMFFKEVTILSANYHSLESEKRMGVLSMQDAELKRNKLLMQILSIPDDLVCELQNAA
ncbi:MAG: hypothetical protein JNM95_11835 [Chitinophagaceae bacterium]|nr:hypothetical protein [Chitinophagaceae bacterium]